MDKKYRIITGSLVALSIAVAVPTFVSAHGFSSRFKKGEAPIVGKVVSINGTMIGLASRNGETFIVNAKNAVVTKATSTISISNIKVDDTLVVRGTLTGNAMVAATIIDGVPAEKSFDLGNLSKGNALFGIITTTNSSGFILDIKDKNNVSTLQNIIMNTSTAYMTDGKATSSAIIASGQRVIVLGTKDSTTNAIVATRISTIPQFDKKHSLRGRVTMHTPAP